MAFHIGYKVCNRGEDRDGGSDSDSGKPTERHADRHTWGEGEMRSAASGHQMLPLALIRAEEDKT